ncbi:MAG: M28 family peptidase [Anaerolineales bacterium]|nr:M28 family peptidase [Anaerolineales bacterium]
METVNELVQRTEDLVEDLDPMQHLRNFDYPRRAGTEGDRKASAYIAQVLEHNGIEHFVQEFHFSKPKVLPRLILPLVLLIWTFLSLANLQFWENNLIISLIVLALPLVFILAVLNIDLVMKYMFGRQRRKIQQVATKIDAETLQVDQVITSQNVIAEVGPENAEKQVLFTAHFDSISSKLPMRVMMVCGILGFIGLILYSLFYLINVGIDSFLEVNFLKMYFPVFVAFALVVLTCLEITLLSRIFRGNASHGMIDDGTGVAILLELAKFVKNQKIPGIKFTFGFFGAEESGLIGSAYYYMNRGFDVEKLHVISIDMIGERPPLSYVKGIYPIRRRHMDSTFNAQIASIAQTLDIETKGINFPYPGSDFGHFLLDGECTTNWFTNGSHLIHSKQDNLSNVNEALVKDALKLVVAHFLQV